jgi:hypothetical protein
MKQSKYDKFVENIFIPGILIVGVVLVCSGCGSISYFIIKAAQAIGC